MVGELEWDKHALKAGSVHFQFTALEYSQQMESGQGGSLEALQSVGTSLRSGKTNQTEATRKFAVHQDATTITEVFIEMLRVWAQHGGYSHPENMFFSRRSVAVGRATSSYQR